MCAPATLALATFALTAASAGAAYYGQKQAADAQEKFQNEQAKQTNIAANAAYNRNVEQEMIRVGQERDASAQRLFEERRNARRAASQARVASAEAGVSGLSVDALQGQLALQEGETTQTINRNFNNVLTDSSFRLQGYRADAINQIASSRPAPVTQPSALAAGLQIGSGAMDAYSTYRREKLLERQSQFNPQYQR